MECPRLLVGTDLDLVATVGIHREFGVVEGADDAVVPIAVLLALVDGERDVGRVADGTADAEKDIQSGVLKVWTQPLPSPPWAGKYFRLCKDKGIALKSTRTVDEFKTDYITDYNRRMMAEIDKKWGAGILQKLERQAQEQ